ncbi:major facilitator superfamily domain-containing protein [Pelagophyceae sp. CCMP2097]|nr:major facilitator superfamily domain-containing protein [Pelagophyceae sp. CCMP2097]
MAASGAPPQRLNWNVRTAMIFAPCLTVCTSISTSAPLAAYILLRTGSNARVGVAVGAQGIANLAAALPAAIAGDRTSKGAVIRAAVFVGILGMAALAAAVTLLDDAAVDPQFYVICVASAVFGVFMGGHSACVEALFADSVETGRRSELYQKRAALKTAGNSAGPLVSMLIFWRLGNKWKKSELESVITLGAMLFLVPASLAAFGFREHKTLGEASEAVGYAPLADAPEPGPAAAESPRAEKQPQAPFWVRRRIPLSVVAADTLSMLGSGMTIKYFPLFFWKDCGLSPIQVNAIYAAGPLGIAASTVLAQKLSKRLGRVGATVSTKLAGIALLVAMTRMRDTRLVVATYVLRTWLMNCCSGLTRSVLNDYVPKAERARWNAFESVNLFSWSGSAVLGGYLIERSGYRATFLATAAMQLVAVAMLASVAHLVRAEGREEDESDRPSELGYSLVGGPPLADEADADIEPAQAPLRPP